MNIQLLANDWAGDEAKQAFSKHTVSLCPSVDSLKPGVELTFIYDALLVREVDFSSFQGVVVLPVTTRTLQQYRMDNPGLPQKILGFSGWPGALQAGVLEVSVEVGRDAAFVDELQKKLSKEMKAVKDRLALVTPRVICMIINEAYLTLQEGTASAEDIDRAMKLGTNYPFGPLEWSHRIGIERIYRTLEALNKETHQQRYAPAALLREQYRDSQL